MFRENNLLLNFGDLVFASQPFRQIKGLLSAYVAYPFAERLEKRIIRPKVLELRKYYQLPFEERLSKSRNSLADMMVFAGQNVPYYKDLFAQLRFNPEKVRRDTSYLNELPYLTKDIIHEQGNRLLSRSLEDLRHYACKTGGSTGVSAVIQYDQEAADYSAAVTLYIRERIGKKKSKSELHFACHFPDVVESKWFSRENLKCFAMNRSNIFFDRIDNEGLEEIWRKLSRCRPFLVHAHPSTIYALASYVENKYSSGNAFDVFESSGELLQPYMREKISKILNCRVVDRYGLAEFGVMAYEIKNEASGLQILESEGWPESRSIDDGHEIVFTGFRNRLMPLIRYATGDLGKVEQRKDNFVIKNLVGRIHDVVPINGVPHATHHIMDMLDHRVGGISEFQIDLRGSRPVLRIVKEQKSDPIHITSKIDAYWPDAFIIEFANYDDLIRVGHRAKFRHVVTA